MKHLLKTCKATLSFVLLSSVVLLIPSPVAAQMDMLPQIFRDLPPELQEGIPDQMQYSEYRRMNRNVDFFTMFMAAIVPGYGLFQVEKPLGAWAIVAARATGYGMMGGAVARQWDDWRDLTQLDSIPDPRYQRYLSNAFVFGGGIVLNGLAWAVDVLAAYHIAKDEKDFVTYKYGLQHDLQGEDQEREIRFIRRLILQQSPHEEQVREELQRALAQYVITYPEGDHITEVEYYLGSLNLENDRPATGLMHHARNLFLHSETSFTRASRRVALGTIQRNRATWSEDWGFLLDMVDRENALTRDVRTEERISAYLEGFQQLQNSTFRRLYVEEALRLARVYEDAAFADHALVGAARQLENLQEYEKAIVVYTQLAGTYPGSEYRPESLLRVAELLRNTLDEPRYAGRFYRRIVEQAPESSEADRAREVLAGFQ
jgi:tetratricopeptide (TPR) repeat protein